MITVEVTKDKFVICKNGDIEIYLTREVLDKVIDHWERFLYKSE